MDFVAARVAEAAGGRLVAGDPDRPGPKRAVIDSRQVGEGDLFVGLPGANVDGGEFAAAVLDAGAWGVLAGDAWTDGAAGGPGAADAASRAGAGRPAPPPRGGRGARAPRA